MDAAKRHQNFLGENVNSKLILLTDTVYPRIKVTYGGVDAVRPAEEIDAEQFIAQKRFKAKGKRLSTWNIGSIEEIEPTRFPEPADTADAADAAEGDETTADGDAADGKVSTRTKAKSSDENLDPDAGKSQQQIIDELTGQTSLFDDKNFTAEDEKDRDWLKDQ